VRTFSSGLLLALVACGRGAATAGATHAEGGVFEQAALPVPILPREAQVEELWTRAAEGEQADLERLHDREGESGLLERALIPGYRMTALQAMGCGTDFVALPYLASVATDGTDAEAEAALESASSLAAVPLRQRDPEDALELRVGCDALLALARRADAPHVRRTRAVSVLRMLTGTGCVASEAIPNDLGSK
jgi:hypothetical protein